MDLSALLCANNPLTSLKLGENDVDISCNYDIQERADKKYYFNASDFFYTYNISLSNLTIGKDLDLQDIFIGCKAYFYDSSLYDYADFLKEANNLEGYDYIEYLWDFDAYCEEVEAEIDTSTGKCILIFPKVEGLTLLNLRPTLQLEIPYTDEDGEIQTYSQTLEISIYPLAKTESTPPSITTAALPDGTKDSEYSSMTATGDTPITWTLNSRTLPDGLALDVTGKISGTPTEYGLYTFTVQASNSEGNDTKKLTITIPFPTSTAPAITTETLTDGQQFKATGTTPITWSADSLPSGLSLSSAGYLRGTPTTAGNFSFTVKAANSAGSDTKTFSLAISSVQSGEQPEITTETMDTEGEITRRP